MIPNSPAYATIPAAELDRARHFYGNVLGLEEDRSDEAGTYYRAGKGTIFFVFKSMGQSSGSHTQLGFQVEDIDAAVADLKARGVVMEEYDYPNFKTVNSIVETPAGRAGWFRDTEGNLLGVFQPGE